MAIKVNFTPSKKQHLAWQKLTDNITHFIGYGGAAFGGKSYLICYWITIMCLLYPDTAWGLGRRELTNLKRTTLLTLFKVFKECNIIADVDYKYNQQSNIITFNNGSQIFLIDTAYKPSDPLYTRFGGYELTGCAIDESNETSYKAIEILYTRTNRRNNKKYGLTRKMFECFNPSKDHVYGRYYKPYKENRMKDSYAFIPALPTDNPSDEAEEYIKGILDNADEITIQRLIRGNFEYDDDLCKLMSYNRILDLFTNEANESTLKTIPVEDGRKHIVVDVARYGADKCIIGLWSGRKLTKIIELGKSSIPEIAAEVEALCIIHKIPKDRVIADDDGVGGGLVDLLGCVPFVNNSRPLNGDNFNHLKSQCYFYLADLVNKGKIFVFCTSEQQTNIVEELEVVRIHNADKDGKRAIEPKDKVKEKIGRSPDYSDMMAMHCWFEIYSGVGMDDAR
jgi:hypothetical protein